MFFLVGFYPFPPYPFPVISFIVRFAYEVFGFDTHRVYDRLGWLSAGLDSLISFIFFYFLSLSPFLFFFFLSLLFLLYLIQGYIPVILSYYYYYYYYY